MLGQIRRARVKPCRAGSIALAALPMTTRARCGCRPPPREPSLRRKRASDKRLYGGSWPDSRSGSMSEKPFAPSDPAGSCRLREHEPLLPVRPVHARGPASLSMRPGRAPPAWDDPANRRTESRTRALPSRGPMREANRDVRTANRGNASRLRAKGRARSGACPRDADNRSASPRRAWALQSATYRRRDSGSAGCGSRHNPPGYK